MSSSVYSSHGSSGTFNPYRHGVLIGNYVEDTFGRDLREKYIKQSKTPTNKNSIPISEFTDKYSPGSKNNKRNVNESWK